MFKGFKNAFRRDSGEKRRKSGSAFDWKNVASPSHLRTGQPNPARAGDDIANHANVFHTQIRQAGLHQMTIALEVWKTGKVTEKDAGILKVPASFFLADGKDADRVHNYSFELFLATFQEKLNRTYPETPTEMLFGRLGFLDPNGIFEAVGDQDSFGVALNNLFLYRETNNILKFVFQPEFEDHRKRRLEAKNGQPTHPHSHFEATINKPERRASFPATTRSNAFQTHQQPTRLNPFATSEYEDGGDDSGRPRTAVSSPASPLSEVINPQLAHPQLLPGRRRQSEHTVAAGPPSPRSTGSGKQSHIGSIKAAVKKAVKGPVKKAPETKEEERERFKTLYQEEKRVTFKRSGDETAAEESAEKLEVVDEEPAEGEAEEQIDEAQEEDAEEEDDISNEDRIVTKYVFFEHCIVHTLK
jgi:hypothetical protein